MAEAQHQLARFYHRGWGVARDEALAAAWLLRAAEQGMTAAQLAFGERCLDGRGVAQDAYRAMEWFFKAAAGGSRDAQYDLGMMYAYGVGVLRNERRASRWLRKAARAGHPQARRQLQVLWQRTASQRQRKPWPLPGRMVRDLHG